VNVSKNWLTLIVGSTLMAVLVVADTLKYSVAWNRYHQYLTNEVTILRINAAKNDLALYESCRANTLTPEAERVCVSRLLAEVQTYIGVVPATFLAEKWLSKHDDDSEIRDATYRMFETGRKSFESANRLFELEEEVASAKNTSYVMRLLGGGKYFSTRNYYAAILRNSENQFRNNFPPHLKQASKSSDQ